jgi:hypothetical protein
MDKRIPRSRCGERQPIIPPNDIQNLHLIVKPSRFILSTHFGLYQPQYLKLSEHHGFKSAYRRHRRRHFRSPLRRHPHPKRGPSNNPRSKRSHWWESMSSFYPGAELPKYKSVFFLTFSFRCTNQHWQTMQWICMYA